MAISGPALSTVKVALGPAAGAEFPAASVAVPAAIDIPIVPLPVIPLIVTVLVLVPAPLTDTEPVAVPVVFKLIFPATNVTDVAPV